MVVLMVSDLVIKCGQIFVRRRGGSMGRKYLICDGREPV